MFLTFFFGFILSLIIYNTFLFVTLKEKTYFYYIAFQVSIFMLLLSYSGMGYHLIWKENHFLNEFIYQKFEVLALFFALVFAQTFLAIKEHSIALNNAINIILLLLIYILLTPWEYHSFLFKIVLIQTVLLGFVMILYSIYKKVKDAKIFFVATIFILFSTLVTFLKIFGFLEVTFITTWSIYIGSMIEATLFSIALANKINALKEREQALISQQNIMLEDEVLKQTESLNNTLKEKEILLKEVNHRVKNNLQVISSFVSFASINSKDKKTLQTLNQRIQAISLLYRSLYKPDSKTTVDMKNYLEHLCREIFKIYMPDIRLSLHAKEVQLDFDKAITVGLLVNEVISNMIEHAFKGIKSAKIELILKKEKDIFTLSIKDNGIGFKSDKNYKSLGLKLIKRLSEKQLKGQLLVKSDNKGSSFIIIFSNV
jgi:two-component sensor histidine kinase